MRSKGLRFLKQCRSMFLIVVAFGSLTLRYSRARDLAVSGLDGTADHRFPVAGSFGIARFRITCWDADITKYDRSEMCMAAVLRADRWRRWSERATPRSTIPKIRCRPKWFGFAAVSCALAGDEVDPALLPMMYTLYNARCERRYTRTTNPRLNSRTFSGNGHRACPSGFSGSASRAS